MMRRRAGIFGICLSAVIMAGTAFPAMGEEAGWRQENGSWYYYLEDGTLLTNAITSDGYLVDWEGVWRCEELDILGQKVTAPDRFVPASQMGDWENVIPVLNELNRRIQQSMGGKRIFHIYEDQILYCRLDSNETELMSLSKNPSTDGYVIRIKTDLGKRNSDWEQAATYDYEVFLCLCALISNRPVQLADSIYQNWQGDNGYGLSKEREVQVMDAVLRYEAENGCGIYYVRRA